MNYTYISTAATTIVRSMPGRLERLIVTGGAAGTITIYDNASLGSGNIIASFDSTNALFPYEFDCEVQNGIVVVTGAATKMTVVSGVSSF